jgi:translation initiation factor 1
MLLIYNYTKIRNLARRRLSSFHSQEDWAMKKLKGLDALADLHRAMGGERANLPSDEGASVDVPGPDVLYVSRDKKARKGKEVTLVEGFDSDQHADLAVETARALKSHCGVGGGWKGGMILLQGDHRDRAAEWLRHKGYTVKHKGG